MAYFFGRGRPRVGAGRAPALVAGVMALRVPGAVPAAGISSEHFQEKWNPIFRPKMRRRKNARAVSVSSNCETALVLDQPRLPRFGKPVFADAVMRAGGLASVTARGRGWAQCDHGRFSV